MESELFKLFIKFEVIRLFIKFEVKRILTKIDLFRLHTNWSFQIVHQNGSAQIFNQELCIQIVHQCWSILDCSSRMKFSRKHPLGRLLYNVAVLWKIFNEKNFFLASGIRRELKYSLLIYVDRPVSAVNNIGWDGTKITRLSTCL